MVRDWNLRSPFAIREKTRLEFVQYMDESLQRKADGKFMDANRVSTHLQHTGVIVPIERLDAAMAFHRDKLGFREY